MICGSAFATMSSSSFRPGEIWLDTAGQPINAHGGGVLFHEGVYYWYGECRPAGPSTLNAQIGVSCYSSRDLYQWKNEGVALSVVKDDEKHPLTAGCKVERPKVLFNRGTGKFVMWWHHDIKGWGHAGAYAGVAVSDTPAGPFRFIEILKPAWRMFRDCTAFQDEDGTGYLIFASDDNINLNICQLSDDYLKPTERFINCFQGRYMEAPCLFKRENRYYLIASACTGWWPNEARSAIAASMWGNWVELGNPCLGEGAEVTFKSQSTFVLPVQGKKDAFIFMADRWTPEHLEQSSYLWLPIEFRAIPGNPGPRPFIRWRDEWDLSVFDAPATS